MVARRYGIYLRVFTSISNEWEQRTSEISNVNTRRQIPYLQVFMYYSVYYINILITMFLTTFRRFPTTFRRFSKTVPKAWRTSPNIFRTFSKNFRRFPKVAEDFRGGADDVSIIQHHLWVLFERLCSYSNSNLKTCDNNLIFSRMMISCFIFFQAVTVTNSAI